ncbi:MAG: spore cortex-lytic protein, partial [Clostridia bacterium]|nr:spore cortex-lytic protein [Clostridia bacterium]
MNELLPVIPEKITVHLGGSSDKNADNVTVDFPDYIKNCASCEIYPTWPDASIRANIYAMISFALNRVYTQYYRVRNHDFDITNNTAEDQSYIRGHAVFDVINDVVDEIFNSYIKRAGSVEPLFAAYCNGTTSTCRGLSQWGSVSLAEQG